MSRISIRANDPATPIGSSTGAPPIGFVGSFDTETAQYWCGDGQPRRVDVPGYPGEYVMQPREHERLWHTADGRWVITNDPIVNLLTDEQAEQWFTDNGYTAEDRDALVRSGHLEGRPAQQERTWTLSADVTAGAMEVMAVDAGAAMTPSVSQGRWSSVSTLGVQPAAWMTALAERFNAEGTDYTLD